MVILSTLVARSSLSTKRGSAFSRWHFQNFLRRELSSLSKMVSYHIFIIILICKAKNHITETAINIGGGAKKVNHDLLIKEIIDLLQVALESFTLNGVACTLAELSLWLLLNVSVLISSTSVASFPQLGEYYSSCFLQTLSIYFVYAPLCELLCWTLLQNSKLKLSL